MDLRVRPVMFKPRSVSVEPNRSKEYIYVVGPVLCHL